MQREQMLRRLDETPEWDMIVVGGGASGVGVAIDAASRGYRVLLLEQHDFGKGTSSRSTKLAHGGVRYLQQGNLSLVFEALRERGTMLRNAPHLVRDQAFVIPTYKWWQAGYYAAGMKVYDALAWRRGFGSSRLLSRKRAVELVPNVNTRGLRGGVLYHDGQFDDSRLIINMVSTAAGHGATLINYMKVTGLLRRAGRLAGVQVRDLESQREYEVKGRVVVNCTGPFTDSVRRMENADAQPMISPSQGVHIVLDRSFLSGTAAILVPRTDDGRVLYAIPWNDCVIAGTTDTPIPEVSLEPRPLPEEIEFLLSHCARYMNRAPSAQDVLSVFVGIRPLVSNTGKGTTSRLSRDHTVHISEAGLVTLTGGKWTTYRNMAEDAVNQAAAQAGLPPVSCRTATLPIHGYHTDTADFGRLASYGSDAPALLALMESTPEFSKPLHPERPYVAAEVVWSVRHEMARTVEDFLSRRTRALLLGASVSIEMAPAVACIMARELGRGRQWIDTQVEEYTELARGYMLPEIRSQLACAM